MNVIGGILVFLFYTFLWVAAAGLAIGGAILFFQFAIVVIPVIFGFVILFSIIGYFMRDDESPGISWEIRIYPFCCPLPQVCPSDFPCRLG